MRGGALYGSAYSLEQGVGRCQKECKHHRPHQGAERWDFSYSSRSFSVKLGGLARMERKKVGGNSRGLGW